jgi:long-chain acyl-CoA synthetase
MNLLERITDIWRDSGDPFLISTRGELFVSQIDSSLPDLSMVKTGDVVALIGDFDSSSIASLLYLSDLGAIVMPLSILTKIDHDYFFHEGKVQFVIEDSTCTSIAPRQEHDLLNNLRQLNHPGLILFSTGTTGRPKAILHDMTEFIGRYGTPRPALRTLSFLLFDHIGGINTLLHTLFNRGLIVAPEERTVSSILETCTRHNIELLPTTPTFLRMLLTSGLVPSGVPECLKVITYGTERMDNGTLAMLCQLLPKIDFRQTYGMSELGILRVKSAARNSLYMSIGGEGIETRVVNNSLQIRSKSRMLGYLNADSPFFDAGWYDTKDLVEEVDGKIRISGRVSEFVNVGGLKFMLSEVERVAIEIPGVSLVSARARDNPITGQHVELTIQPKDNFDLKKEEVQSYLKETLQPHMRPLRVTIGPVTVGHRFKKI